MYLRVGDDNPGVPQAGKLIHSSNAPRKQKFRFLPVGDDNLGVPQAGIKFTEVMTRGGTYSSNTEINIKIAISSERDAKVVVPYKCHRINSVQNQTD